MIGLIDANGDCFAIVASTAGYDLTGLTLVDPVPEPLADYVWDSAQQAFVPRPPSPGEDFEADTLWPALRTATPAQIEAWLASNVTNLAEARRVLKLILLALRALHSRRSL